MTYGTDFMHALLDAAREARLSDEANAAAFAAQTTEVRTQFDRIADTAERVGYTQALVDVLRLLDHDRDGPAVDIVTALARQKGIGK